MKNIPNKNYIVNKIDIKVKNLGQKNGLDILIENRSLGIRRLMKKYK